MKGNNLMDKHVAKVQLHIKPQKSVYAYTIHRKVEDWMNTNNTTVEITIHPGQINVVIFPQTVKPQEYRYLMKGLEK